MSVGDVGLSALVVGQYSDSLREVDGRLRFSHKRITIERVVTIPAGTQEYMGVPSVAVR